MIPATRESVQPIIEDLQKLSVKVLLVGDLRRGEENPSERADILVVPDPSRLAPLSSYVNNELGRVMKGRVGPNDELSKEFPCPFMKLTGRIKLCIWFRSPKEFGLSAFCLTGPAFFVQRGLDYWPKIEPGGKTDGRLLFYGPDNPIKDGFVDTSTEEKVFEALKCKFIEPEKRK